MTTEADQPVRRRSWGSVLLRIGALSVAFLGLVAFSVVLAKITLTPSPASEGLVTANLRPGRSLRQYAESYTFLAACKQAGGNLLLGVPFGILLPVLVPRRLRMIRMVLLTVLVMAVVELVQGALVAGRAFDVDDVILNTAGALLGYALLGRRISHRYHVLGDRLPVAGPTGPAPGPAPDPAAGQKAERGLGRWSRSRRKSGKKPRPRTGIRGRRGAGNKPGE